MLNFKRHELIDKWTREYLKKEAIQLDQDILDMIVKTLEKRQCWMPRDVEGTLVLTHEEYARFQEYGLSWPGDVLDSNTKKSFVLAPNAVVMIRQGDETRVTLNPQNCWIFR